MDWLEWPDGLDAGVLIGVLALLFTVASFWWLNARRGSLVVNRPLSYGFVNKVRLRLPLAFYNSGAVALIVTDLRVKIGGDDARKPLAWQATFTALNPSKAEAERDFATPFAVPGRGTRELVAEFGDDAGWSPQTSSKHRLQLQAKIHPGEKWRDLVIFDWWAPPPAGDPRRFLTYRNSLEHDA